MEYCVAVFPDIASVFSESSDRSGYSVLASVALYHMGSGRVYGRLGVLIALGRTEVQSTDDEFIRTQSTFEAAIASTR
jgi:hypothetical protein